MAKKKNTKMFGDDFDGDCDGYYMTFYDNGRYRCPDGTLSYWKMEDYISDIVQQRNGHIGTTCAI